MILREVLGEGTEDRGVLKNQVWEGRGVRVQVNNGLRKKITLSGAMNRIALKSHLLLYKS